MPKGFSTVAYPRHSELHENKVRIARFIGRSLPDDKLPPSN
jgi:hypothetical protein